MNTRILLLVAMFALLAMGTAIVSAETVSNIETFSFTEYVSGGVQPMSSCGYVCAYCIPKNKYGSCTMGGVCC